MGSGRMEEGAVPSDWGQAAGFIEEVIALEYGQRLIEYFSSKFLS